MDGVGTGEGRVAGAGVLGGPAQRLDDEVDRLEHVGPPVDAVADLTGTDQDRCAGVDHGFLQRRRDVLDCLVNSRDEPGRPYNPRHRRARPLHREPVPLADGGGPAAPPPRAGRRGRHGVVGRALRGRRAGHRTTASPPWPTAASTSRGAPEPPARRGHAAPRRPRDRDGPRCTSARPRCSLPGGPAEDVHPQGAGRGRGGGRARPPTSRSTPGSPASPPDGSPGPSSGWATTTSSTWPTRSAGAEPTYEATADLLDRLLGEVVDLAFPVHCRAEGQRA